MLLLALLLLVAVPAFADPIEGRVIRVADGDTVTLLVDRQPVRVRLAGIDAPEKRQPFGERSRQHLARLLADKVVTADCHKADRYGRQVCSLWVQPGDCLSCARTLDAGHAQLTAGLAWWYRQYATEQTSEERGRYESAEREARARRLGLWHDGHPVAPWDWRRKSK